MTRYKPDDHAAPPWQSEHGNPPGSPRRISSWWVALPGTAALALLALASLAGNWVRPSADDWCVLVHVNRSGPVGLASYYFHSWSGRVAKGIPEGLVWHWRGLGPRLLPAGLILVLVSGTWVLLRVGLRRVDVFVPKLAALALSAGATVLTLLAGTVPYQLTFWVAGSMTHTAPVAVTLLTLSGALLMTGRAHPAWRPAALALVAAGGIVIGAWNEAFAPVAVAYGLIVILAALALSRGRRHRHVVVVACTWCASVLVGFFVLYTSPGLDDRKRVLHQAAPWTPAGASDILNGWARTWWTILSEPSYYAIIAIGVLTGLTLRVTERTTDQLRPHRWAVLTVPALTVLATSLVVIAELRQGYGTNGWTYERTWATFLFPAMLVFGFYGAALGYAVRTRRRLLVWLPAVAAVAGAAAFLTMWPRTVSLAHEMHDRAAAWDANDVAVRRQIARGSRRPTFVPTPIAGSHEPFNPASPGKADWVAGCVAQYLGVKAIVPHR